MDGHYSAHRKNHQLSTTLETTVVVVRTSKKGGSWVGHFMTFFSSPLTVSPKVCACRQEPYLRLNGPLFSPSSSSVANPHILRSENSNMEPFGSYLQTKKTRKSGLLHWKMLVESWQHCLPLLFSFSRGMELGTRSRSSW